MKRFLSLLLRFLGVWDRREAAGSDQRREWQQAVSSQDEQEFKRLLLTLPEPGPFDLSQYEHQSLLVGRCPDCNSDDLRAGPCGGLSQNVMCGDCTSEFNVSPVMSERLSPAGKGIRTGMYGVFKA